MPHLKELHEKHAKDGLVILAVHSMRGKETCAAFVKKNSIPYTVAIDTEGKTAKAYYVDGYPDYHVIGRDGKVRYGDLFNGDVDRAIELLLAEPVPADLKKKGEKPAP